MFGYYDIWTGVAKDKLARSIQNSAPIVGFHELRPGSGWLDQVLEADGRIPRAIVCRDRRRRHQLHIREHKLKGGNDRTAELLNRLKHLRKLLRHGFRYTAGHHGLRELLRSYLVAFDLLASD